MTIHQTSKKKWCKGKLCNTEAEYYFDATALHLVCSILANKYSSRPSSAHTLCAHSNTATLVAFTLITENDGTICQFCYHFQDGRNNGSIIEKGSNDEISSSTNLLSATFSHSIEVYFVINKMLRTLPFMTSVPSIPTCCTHTQTPITVWIR